MSMTHIIYIRIWIGIIILSFLPSDNREVTNVLIMTTRGNNTINFESRELNLVNTADSLSTEMLQLTEKLKYTINSLDE